MCVVRSAGWWLMDKASYYSEGNFMTYKNGVRRFIEETQVGVNGLGLSGYRDSRD